jgi:hypothetical protein
MVGVVALMLAVAAIGAGTAFAQTTVVSATTIAAQPDGQSNVDPRGGEDKPKAEKPSVEAPKAEKPSVEAPKTEKPSVEAPKTEKPSVEAPKTEKPKPEKSKPAPAKPTAESPMPTPGTPMPTPESPKSTPESPNPAQPKAAQPKRAQAGAPSAQPNEPVPEPQVDVAKPVSPRHKAAASVPASGVRQFTTTRDPAANQNRKAARRRASAASPERSGTSFATSGGDSADANPAASGPPAVTPRRAPRLASDGVAEGAAASLDRQQPRVLIAGGPPGYNVLTPLLLAILFAAGVGYLVGREVRRARGLGARRPATRHRGARPRPAAHRRERFDRQFRRRLVQTRSSALARRSALAPLLLLLRTSSSRAVAFLATQAPGVGKPDGQRLVLLLRKECRGSAGCPSWRSPHHTAMRRPKRELSRGRTVGAASARAGRGAWRRAGGRR